MSMIYMGKFDPMAMLNGALDVAKNETKSLNKKLPDKLSTAVGGEIVGGEKVQVYKWRDANGVMQFSSTPPTGRQAEHVTLDTNTNLMQAVKVKEKTEPKPEQQAQAAMPKPYSVKGMKKVMDDARGVEEMLQKRHAEQQKMLINLVPR